MILWRCLFWKIIFHIYLSFAWSIKISSKIPSKRILIFITHVSGVVQMKQNNYNQLLKLSPHSWHIYCPLFLRRWSINAHMAQHYIIHSNTFIKWQKNKITAMTSPTKAAPPCSISISKWEYPSRDSSAFLTQSMYSSLSILSKPSNIVLFRPIVYFILFVSKCPVFLHGIHANCI